MKKFTKLVISKLLYLSISTLLVISFSQWSCKDQKAIGIEEVKEIKELKSAWTGPNQYVFCVAADWEYSIESRVKTQFGSSIDKSVAIGVCPIFYIFERSASTIETELREHLRLAQEQQVPILVQFDPCTFMDGRPELWNWWDSASPGYNVANKENVEWTSWSSNNAVKIGWLNWGSQTRLKPMANLSSTAYKNAVTTDMTNLIDIVKAWYDGLPSDQKWLFGGIKVTPEVWIGVNNWYYPNGNSYLDQNPSNDPTYGLTVSNRPSRGVQTIGYAGVKTAGIRTSGTITGDDISELARQFCEFTSQLCSNRGIARDRIFAHAGGADVTKDLEACINQYSCPSWSFYLSRPSQYTAALNVLATSNAAYFGISEWSSTSGDASEWTKSIDDGLCINRCRYLSVYTNVVGKDGTEPNMTAIQGIQGVQSTVVLTTNQQMSSDQQVMSPNGNYTLWNQSDGNLVIYSSSGAVWSTVTSGQGASTLQMQDDGNLVLYKNGGGATWGAGCYQGGTNDYYCVLNNSGKLIVYRGTPSGTRTQIWSN